MFNRNKMLAYFEYFLYCPHPYLIRTRGIKSAKNT